MSKGVEVLRRLLIAGNWKMHKTPPETEDFIADLLRLLPASPGVDILLIPPFTSFDRAVRLLTGLHISLGAQDLHPEVSGAFTGAVSGAMIRACGCQYVLVGHSERRCLFADDDLLVGRKLTAALAADLLPMLCVGETLDERHAEQTEAILTRQLTTALETIDSETMRRVTIAYEPVWAIGTGETATADQAQAAVRNIREWVAERFDGETSQRTRILYGGSVKPENAATLFRQPDVDGGLVGGASLDAEAFTAIVDAAQP